MELDRALAVALALALALELKRGVSGNKGVELSSSLNSSISSLASSSILRGSCGMISLQLPHALHQGSPKQPGVPQ